MSGLERAMWAFGSVAENDFVVMGLVAFVVSMCLFRRDNVIRK